MPARTAKAALAAVRHRIDLPILFASIAAAGIKVASAALNYGLLILLARLLPVEAFGQFGVLFSAAILVGALLVLGQPVLILKSIPQYEAQGDALRQKGIVLFGTGVLTASCAAFLLLLLIAGAADLLPREIEGARLAAAFGALVVVHAVSDYTCNLLRAFGHTYSGLVPRDVIWRASVIAIILALHTGVAFDVFAVLALLALVLCVLVCWQILQIRRLIAAKLPGAAVYDRREWSHSSVWMAIGSLLFIVSMTVDTVIVGALLGTADVAVYFAAARTAAVSSILLVGLRLVAAPLFAQLHYAGESAEVRKRVEMVYGLSAATAVAVGTVAFVFAPQIMQVFGAEFAEGVTAFRILIVGLTIATSGGMSQSILESTGGERLNAAILIVTQTLTALAVALAAKLYGLNGAAAAKATGVALEAVILSACVFTRFAFGRTPAPEQNP